MTETDSLIEKGRKRLKILIGLGLSIPMGFALFFFGVSVNQYDSRRSTWFDFPQNDDNVLFLFFLFLSLVGFLVGRSMYKGKEWAQALWNSIGFFCGGLMFILSLVASMADTRVGIPFLLFSMLILVVTLQGALHKGVRAYFKSLRYPPSIEDKIEEIGKMKIDD